MRHAMPQCPSRLRPSEPAQASKGAVARAPWAVPTRAVAKCKVDHETQTVDESICMYHVRVRSLHALPRRTHTLYRRVHTHTAATPGPHATHVAPGHGAMQGARTTRRTGDRPDRRSRESGHAHADAARVHAASPHARPRVGTLLTSR